MLARIELRAFQCERLDALSIEDIFDRCLNRFENAANVGGSLGAKVGGNPGVDHLANVVVKLDQVDKDRPLNFQEKILLVVLKLGMKPVNDALARRLGATRVQTSSGACRAAGRSAH